jgi:hypothetical protein
MGVAGKAGSARMPNKAALGSNTRSNCSRFCGSSLTKMAMPVTFAPGRLRLATRRDASAPLDDRYGRGRCLRRRRCGVGDGYDHCDAAAVEIGCKRRQPIVLIFRPAVFNRNVLVLDIAGFLQALKKRNGEVLVVIISGFRDEDADHRNRRLLRPRHGRPCLSAAEPRDKLAPPHR